MTSPGSSRCSRRPGISQFLDACLSGETADPQLNEAVQITQHEIIHFRPEFGQAMAWKTVYADGADAVDKPGGLNNASA